MIRIVTPKHATRILARKTLRMKAAETVVRPILKAVRERGDAALLEYARRFDGLARKSVAVHPRELQAAAALLPPAFRSAFRTASKNIRAFARLQMPQPRSITVSNGVRLSEIVRPLDSIGAYIPSGRHPLPSTLLMTVIPAQVAGVPNISVASPRPSREVYGVAAFLKVDRVFQMGGAHAIAAFAYGTRTVPRADRIVGPGNVYVAAAKRLLAGDAGIDFIAGPTETLIIAEEGNPVWIAADLLAQAEHDDDASAILLTTSKALAKAVSREIDRQVTTLPTAAAARLAIEKNCAIIMVNSMEEAMDLSNSFAPEHLSIPDAKLLSAVRHAGAVFIGPTSPEAAGDYASGLNHVLPTSGAARVRGGLSTADYVKRISVQTLSAAGLRSLAPAIATFARAEGLEAHARSVEVRARD